MNYMNERRLAYQGFTLIEILIVVVILGILAAVVVPQFTNAADDANHAAQICFSYTPANFILSVRKWLFKYARKFSTNYPQICPQCFTVNLMNFTVENFHCVPEKFVGVSVGKVCKICGRI